MKFKAAIFDMDGTLTDSMYIWDTAGITYLENQGITPAPDLRERLRPLSLEQAAELYQQEYGVTDSIPEILEGIDAVVEEAYHHVTLKPGALELLKELSIPKVLATSSPRRIVVETLDRLGILTYFDKVLTCGEIGIGKDQPDIYLQAAAFMESQPSETLVFEDALHAVRTASAAGFHVIGVFDASEGINEAAIRPLCKDYVKSLEDLLDKK